MNLERTFNAVIGTTEAEDGSVGTIDHHIMVRAGGVTAAAELAVQDYLERRQESAGGSTFMVLVFPEPTGDDPNPSPWTITVFADSTASLN